MAAHVESEIRKLFEVGGRRSEWRFCRQRFLGHGNPACRSIRNCGGFRPKCELTSAEMAMSGSYFDDRPCSTQRECRVHGADRR
jgi:hypothetical protein